MLVRFEKLVCQGVLLIGKHSSAFLHSHDHLTKDASTIREETVIVLEHPSGFSEVMIKTFILLDEPLEAGEGITVLTEDHTFDDVVPGISCPVGVPPKPSDAITASKASSHDDSR